MAFTSRYILRLLPGGLFLGRITQKKQYKNTCGLGKISDLESGQTLTNKPVKLTHPNNLYNLFEKVIATFKESCHEICFPVRGSQPWSGPFQLNLYTRFAAYFFVLRPNFWVGLSADSCRDLAAVNYSHISWLANCLLITKFLTRGCSQYCLLKMRKRQKFTKLY